MSVFASAAIARHAAVYSGHTALQSFGSVSMPSDQTARTSISG